MSTHSHRFPHSNAQPDTQPDAQAPTHPKLRPRHVSMIALGGIIGASLFVGSGTIIRTVGPAAIISYLIGGVLALLAMRMLGEMAAERPALGSFMEYARVGLGDWAAYLVGWLYWYFWVGVIAYEAVLGGETLHSWFTGVPGWAGTLLLLALFVSVNLCSVRTFGEVEFWLSSIKVLAIVVFLIGGATYALGLWPASVATVSNLWAHGGFAPNGIGVALTGVSLVIFSYFGIEIAVMASAESEDPAQGIRRATNTIIWRILLFFVGAILVITAIIPWDELPAPTDVTNAPFTLVFEALGVPGASVIMQLVIFTAVVSVLNSGLYSASRMLRALAEQHYAPSVLCRSTPRGVPVAALLASTSGGVLAALINILAPNTGIFDFIINSTGLVGLTVYVFITLTQWRLRDRMSAAHASSLTLRVWLHPWLNLILCGAVGTVFIVMVCSEAGRSQVWASLIAMGVVAACWPQVRSRLRATKAHQATLTYGAPHH